MEKRGVFRSRNNLSTIDEAFADCALTTPPGTPPLWGTVDPFRTTGADVCGFSNHLVLNAFGE